jgi:hypothetical protein
MKYFLLLVELMGVNIFLLVSLIICCGIWVSIVEDRLRNIEKGLNRVSFTEIPNQFTYGNNQTNANTNIKKNSYIMNVILQPNIQRGFRWVFCHLFTKVPKTEANNEKYNSQSKESSYCFHRGKSTTIKLKVPRHSRTGDTEQ